MRYHLRPTIAFAIVFASLTPSLFGVDLTDAQLEPGDRFQGRIALSEDVDRVTIECLAGTQIDVVVASSPEHGLKPMLALFGPDGSPVKGEISKISKSGHKAWLRKLKITEAGPYEVRIWSGNGKLGDYEVRVEEKIKTKFAKKLGGKSTESLKFPARAGSAATLKVLMPAGTTSQVELVMPSGGILVSDEDWAESTGGGGSKVVAGPVVLPEDGDYLLMLHGDGGGSVGKAKVLIDPPSASSNVVYESPGNASIAGSVTLGDGYWLDADAPYCADEIVVRIDRAFDADILAATLEARVIARSGEWARMRRLDATDPELARTEPDRRRVVELLTRARATPGVTEAEPNQIRQPLQMPSDPLFPIQWDMSRCGFEEAWEIEPGDSFRSVAVLDTGVWFPHPDLAGRLFPGMDFVSDTWNAGDGNGIDGDPTDTNLAAGTHGTHVIGTIIARHDNGIGIAGGTVNGSVLPVRVLGILGGTDFDIAQGILYSAGLPNAAGVAPPVKADVINMSLGGPNYSALLADAVEQARAAGVVVVAAAGNTNSNHKLYPAALNGVIAVSATDALDGHAYYSTFGPQVDIAAPGGNTKVDKNGDGEPDGILSTTAHPYDGAVWTQKAGTSMASPHVAAAAFLLRSAVPTLTPSLVEGYLMAGGEDLGDVGRDDVFGHGLLDVEKSLTLAKGLASGPPELFVAPQVLYFDPMTDQLEVALVNLGQGVISVTSVTSDSFWLTPIDQVAETPGTIRVAVDREGLVSSDYLGELTLYTNIGVVHVPVRLEVSTQEPIGVMRLFVVVIDVISDLPIAVKEVMAEEADEIRFDDLPEGTYRLVAATDLDHDGMAGEEHDYSWEFMDPTLGKPKLLLPDGASLENLEILLAAKGALSTGPIPIDAEN